MFSLDLLIFLQITKSNQNICMDFEELNSLLP